MCVSFRLNMLLDLSLTVRICVPMFSFYNLRDIIIYFSLPVIANVSERSGGGELLSNYV